MRTYLASCDPYAVLSAGKRRQRDIEQSSNSKGVEREREKESTVGISYEDKDRLPCYPFCATFNESIHVFVERREAGISIRHTERKSTERGC